MNLTELSTERVVLDRLKIAATGRVSPYVVANMELATWQDELLGQLVYQLRSDVLAKTLEKRTIDQRVEFEAPASTWQMFKKTHEHGRWLGWIARRWPVAYTTTAKWVTVESRLEAVFPDATVKFPDTLGKPVYIERLVAT